MQETRNESSLVSVEPLPGRKRTNRKEVSFRARGMGALVMTEQRTRVL